MSTTSQLSPQVREAVIRADRRIYRLSRHWMAAFTLLYGIFVGLPLIAPIFMQLGWQTPARLIYSVYSVLCHQLPERSFFIFGAETMYSLSEIQAAWKPTLNPLVLRQFVGSPAMGWKVAWSDRMVSMYTSVLLIAVLWWPFRRKIKALPLWAFFLFLVPMGIDGISHLLSDFAGLGQGFRYDNQWLATLTANQFPVYFYVGDALGSFNSWMRLLSGLLFGLGTVWLAMPYAFSYFNGMGRLLEIKFERAGLRLE